MTLLWFGQQEKSNFTSFFSGLINIMIQSNSFQTDQAGTLTFVIYRLIITMGLLKPIYILSQLISIGIYFLHHVTQRNVKKAFHMHRLLGLDVFVLRLLLLSTGLRIWKSFW